MRICLTHMRHAITGGTELFLNYLAAYLSERGHEVTVVCRTHGPSPHPGVRFVVLRDFALVKIWRIWSFAKSVDQYVKNNQYDVVFGLGKTWSQDIIRLGGGTHRTYVEKVQDESGFAWWRKFKDNVVLKIERRALLADNCRAIIVNSDMVREDVIARYGIARDKVRRIYNGIDLRRFHPGHRASHGMALREACGYKPDDIVFLFLGSGFQRKGLDVVLEAFPAVLASHSNARLLVVGRDSAVEIYKSKARSLGIDSNVCFLGPRMDTEACYGAADVYVLPTRYDPFAFTVLEALACGVPVVTSTACGAGELIREESQGSLFTFGDHNAQRLAEIMESWCDHSRISKARGAARKLAEQYDINFGLAEIEELLTNIAK